MGFQVYDYRTDHINVLVTPELRARLYRMAPGQVDGRHSHDLGHEVFLILEGRAAFEIAGETKELGPGQMCIARADEIHQVRNLLPDKPTIMYLSVTPHIQPTHTGRDEEGARQPPIFRPNNVYDVESDLNVALDTLLERHLAAMRSLAGTVQAAADIQEKMGEQLADARANGDQQAAEAARNAMWEAIYQLHKSVFEMGQAWNELAPRMTEGLDGEKERR
jgi:quercetin dioxygenase-like cupin family protein